MHRWTSAALLFLANTLWGTSYVVAKVALDQLPAPLIGAIRFPIVAVTLWLIILVRRLRGGADRAPVPAPAAGDTWKLLGLGVISVAATHLISNIGQSWTTATDASLMIIGEVIFTTVLGALILHERPGPWKKIGVVIGAAGAVTLIYSSAQGTGGVDGLLRAAGDSLILLGLVGEALYSIVGTFFVRRYSRLTVTALVNTGSLVVWIPILLWYIASGRFPWGADWTAFAGVIYLAVINSVICFLIWFGVLESAPANVGAISLFAQPLVGAALGITLMGDRITPSLVAGAVLVMAALFFSTLRERN